MIEDTLEALESTFLNSEKFYKEVDDLVWKDDIEYLDAIMIICDDKDINPEDLVKLDLISPLLKSKLNDECTISGALKRSPSLF